MGDIVIFDKKRINQYDKKNDYQPFIYFHDIYCSTKNFQMKPRLDKKINLLVFIVIFVLGGIYSVIAISSHNHFQTFGWDLGFFDQIIWKASRGDLIAYSTLAKENLLADHFQIVLYFLAPLYLIMSDVRLLLVAQSFLVVFASYFLFLLARDITKNIIFSFSVVFASLLFIGTQWTILNEFHQTAFVPLFIILLFYGLHFKKTRIYWMGIIGLLITKEEFSLLVASLGLLVLCGYKKKKTGILTLVIGILSFFFLINYLMPKLSAKGIYSHYDFGEAGYTPEDIIQKSISEPLFFIKSMIYPTVKINTVFTAFLSYGFLPLFSPIYLIPISENFISRFIYAGPQFTQWTNVNHHAAPLGILFSVATIYGAIKIVNMNHALTLIGVYLIFMTIVQNIVHHGPINSIFKPQLYETSDWMKNNYDILKKIPKNASIATQNSLFPHLSQRDKIYLLPETEDAEYIVVDLHDGPNKYSPLNYKEMTDLVSKLLDTKKYSVIFSKGDAIILKAITK